MSTINARRPVDSLQQGWRNSAEEASLNGFARSLAVGVDGAGAGNLYSVKVPEGCNRVLLKSVVTGVGAGTLTIHHAANREVVPGTHLSAPLASITSGAVCVVVDLPPGIGWLVPTTTLLAAGRTLDAEAIFWRETR